MLPTVWYGLRTELFVLCMQCGLTLYHEGNNAVIEISVNVYNELLAMF